MGERLYERFTGGRLSLREHLAAARTILANERTFLAYQRTAITTLAAGVSFIKFFHNPPLEILGWLFIPIAFVTAALGVRRYLRMRRNLHDLEARDELAGEEGR